MRAADKLFWLKTRVFLITWVSYASFYFARKNFPVVKSRLQAELGISITQLGILDTAYLIAYALGQFVSGVLGDRIGPRRLLALGMLGSAATTVSFGLSTVFLPMFIALTVNGLFQSSGWPGTVKAMQPYFNDAERGRVMGFWCTNYQVGGLLATALATFLLVHMGWRFAFLLPAIWVAIVGVAVYLFLTDGAAAPAASTRSADSISGENFWALLTEPLIVLLGGVYFGLKLIRYSLLFWLPYYLRQNFHYSESLAGYGSMPFEIGGVLGSIGIGWLSDRYFPTQRLRLLAPTLFLLGGALLAYQIFGARSLMENALLLSLIGFLLYGPDTFISGTIAQELGGQHASGRVAGVVNGLGSIGGVCSPLLVARVSESYGWSALFYGFIGVTMVAALLAGLAQSLQLRAGALPVNARTGPC